MQRSGIRGNCAALPRIPLRCIRATRFRIMFKIFDLGKMMTKLQYLSSLRKELLNLISNIQDARPGSKSNGGGHTTENSETKRRLNKIFEQYTVQGRAYGVYILKRHVNCNNPKHEGYVMDMIEDKPIKFHDERFSWEYPIYEGEINCICPCSAENRPSKHSVIIDVLFDKKQSTFPDAIIRELFEEIYTAITYSEDNKRRSATREHLLRAVLIINDLILPAPMGEYISEQLKKEKA